MPSVGQAVTTSYLYDINDERISSSKEQRRVGGLGAAGPS